MNDTSRIYCVQLTAPFSALTEKDVLAMHVVLDCTVHLATGCLCYVSSTLADGAFRSALSLLPFTA